MFSWPSTLQNRLQSINLSIDIRQRYLESSSFLSVTWSHMFPKITDKFFDNRNYNYKFTYYIAEYMFSLSVSCVPEGYICNFIDKDNFFTIFRRKKCTREIFSSTRDILPAIFQYFRVIFIAISSIAYLSLDLS